jgi:hypothetical protein
LFRFTSPTFHGSQAKLDAEGGRCESEVAPLGALTLPFKELYMAKIYNGKVSVYADTKKRITIKADTDGKFDMTNVVELYTTIQKLSKQHKMEAKVYKPKANGDTPIIMSDKWGKPYLAVLPAQETPSAVVRTVKLA